MNPGNVLIANPLNPVITKPILQQSWALQGFGNGNLHFWELGFQVVASRQCATGTGR